MEVESQEKTVLDCNQFAGRKRAICEGTSGLPPDVEEKYRRNWARPRGVGDTVKAFIDKWIPDCLKPKAEDCGCKKRQEWLNKAFPYGTESGEKLD